MTKAEIADLLTMVASLDQYPRAVDEVEVTAWLAIAEIEGWQFSHAKRAVVEFHRAEAGRGRITPAHVTDVIRETRRKISRMVADKMMPAPPRALADDPAAEIAWRRHEIHQRVRAVMDSWATGQPLPPPVSDIPAPRTPVPDRMRRLIGGAFAMPKNDAANGGGPCRS